MTPSLLEDGTTTMLAPTMYAHDILAVPKGKFSSSDSSAAAAAASPSASVATMARKKKSFLNKFLTKTYHMIDQCDPAIASWTSGGESFTVTDVDAFERNVLPNYFNHSKFSSFVRQLNFYGFQKQRSDADLQTHTSSVRFHHENFRKGRPELLHNITRTTAGSGSRGGAESAESAAASGRVEALQAKVAALQDRVLSLESRADERVSDAVRVLNENYLARIKNLEATYEVALNNLMQKFNQHQMATTSILSQATSTFQQHQQQQQLGNHHAP